MELISNTHHPKMRRQGLVIDELPDEVLVYDLDRDQAHCLNRTAALVWQSCDGNTTPSEIARQLKLELDADGKKDSREDLVWLALAQLERNNLLEQSVAVPSEFARLSRRRMIRGLGLAAAVAVPLVSSIVAPTAVEAATLAGPGQCCGNPNDCVSNNCNQSPACVGPPSTKACA
jgi:hypothetical protein